MQWSTIMDIWEPFFSLFPIRHIHLQTRQLMIPTRHPSSQARNVYHYLQCTNLRIKSTRIFGGRGSVPYPTWVAYRRLCLTIPMVGAFQACGPSVPGITETRQLWLSLQKSTVGSYIFLKAQYAVSMTLSLLRVCIPCRPIGEFKPVSKRTQATMPSLCFTAAIIIAIGDEIPFSGYLL